ncbi:MAG TPA: hypothetical protein VFY99_01290 [Solirubrobacterales bacterium]
MERSSLAQRGRGATRRIESAVLVTAMLVGAFSLWTVIPLGWLWIGSQIVGTQEPRLWAYFLVLVGITISVIAVAKILSLLNHRYLSIHEEDLEPERKIPLPWLESMRDERHQTRATVLDTVLVASAVMAAIALFIWFVILAESPLPNQ